MSLWRFICILAFPGLTVVGSGAGSAEAVVSTHQDDISASVMNGYLFVFDTIDKQWIKVRPAPSFMRSNFPSW